MYMCVLIAVLFHRQALIDRYNQDPEILVFLLSTKAGRSTAVVG